MKKKRESGNSLWIRLPQKTLLMSLKTIIFLCVCNVVCATGFSQKKMNIDFVDIPITEVIDYLKSNSSYDFIYRRDILNEKDMVTLKMHEASVEEILSAVFRNRNYEFEVTKDVIVIKKSQEKMLEMLSQNPIILKGKVTDVKNNPLPGVTVMIKGLTVGTATDNEGSYSITMPATSSKVILIFTFIGMKTMEKVYDGETTIDVKMEEDVTSLDDVVVTGYGNYSRGNYTGAATVIKAEDIMMAGASTIDQMLQGVVPGLLVQTTSGQVGATPKIRVRGTSTLLGSQEPVWVVDGVIQHNPQVFNPEDNTRFTVDADDISKLAGNAISWLNPYDVETITILKDASATAIYGSQAANGVIVITTKKARAGRLTASYAGDFSIGQRPRYGLYDRMNSQELMTFSKEMYEERASYPTTFLPIGYAALVDKLINKEITYEEMNEEYTKMAKRNTDWFKLLFRNSFNHKHTVSFGGGSESLVNRTSFSFNEEKGEAIGNDLNNFTAYSNTTLNLNNKLILNMILNGSIRKVDGFAYGVDPFNYAYNTTRVIPVYNEDGTYYYHEKWGVNSQAIVNKTNYNYNILNELENTHSTNKTRTWGTTIDLTWNILWDIQYKGLVSYTSTSADIKKYATENSFYITQYRGYEYGSVKPNSGEEKSSRIPKGGVLETSTNNTETVIVRNSLSYNKVFKDVHTFLFQVGLETKSTKIKGGSNLKYGYLYNRGETFVDVPLQYYQYGNTNGYAYDNKDFVYGKTSVTNKINNYLSEYATFVYGYDRRYIVNLSARVDASNRFGQDRNKRFEPTWSAGIKWSAHNESFMKRVPWLNNLDITMNFGYQGNAVEGESPYLIAFDGGSGGIGNYYQSYVLRIKSLPNFDLGWEKNRDYDFGVELSILDGRINARFDYFKKISDVLSSRDVPYENGQTNAVVSGSKIKNNGYELDVNFIPVRTKDFIWQISINTSKARNEITKNERVNTLADYLNGSAVVHGEAFSTFYSYEFDVLNSEDGRPLFKNMDLERVDDPIEFLVKSGKFNPDFSGGLNTMLKYKNISFYALFTLQWGGHGRLPDLYHTDSNNGVPMPEQNISRKIVNRWRKEGDEKNTIIPSIPGIGKYSTFYLPPSGTRDKGDIVNPYSQYNNSDVRVAKTDMIRCRQISLSYDFNPRLVQKIYMERMSVKFSMMNPFMWVKDKKWDGIDPETRDWPARRVSSLSVQVTF